jgi:hypothetical protein
MAVAPGTGEPAGRVPVPGEQVQVRPDCDQTLSATGQRTGPGTVTAVHGSGPRATVIIALDGGHSVPCQAAELIIVKSKDSRRAELDKLTKARLIAMYRGGVRTPEGRLARYGASAHPIGTWSKSDVIASIMTAEFPPAVTP